jgi:hypothetical protein
MSILTVNKEEYIPFAAARLDYLHKCVEWREQQGSGSSTAWSFNSGEPNFELEPECYVIKVNGSGKMSDYVLPISEIDSVMPSGYKLSDFHGAYAAVGFWDEAFQEGKDILLLELCIREFNSGEVCVGYRLLGQKEAWAELKEFPEFVAFEQAKEAAEKAVVTKMTRKKEEADFETSLMAFLTNRGVTAVRQVTSGSNRLDILVPGHLIIEIKAGKVTGDDMCQAIDYLAMHKMDVLLVGTGLSDSATRGMAAINLISDHQILFVTKNACFHYLEAVVCKTK